MRSVAIDGNGAHVLGSFRARLGFAATRARRRGWRFEQMGWIETRRNPLVSTWGTVCWKQHTSDMKSQLSIALPLCLIEELFGRRLVWEVWVPFVVVCEVCGF